MRELLLRVGEPRAVDGEPRGLDLVVQRRHEHLDAVRLDDPDAVEQVLLRQCRDGGRPFRGAVRQLVDELVQAARADSARGGAGEQPAAW